jgi:hypothetical protein
MTDLRQVVGEGMGAVSVCWTTIADAGVFQSELAAGIVDEVVAWIEAHYELNSDVSEVLDSSIVAWMDPLMHDERVRLEALVLAVQSMGFPERNQAGKVVEKADTFEQYIRAGRRRLTVDQAAAGMQTPEKARREIYEGVFGVKDYPAEEGAVDLEG